MVRTLMPLLLAAALLAGCGAESLAPACQPVCSGRTCGDDGCGGSCGSCAAAPTCDGAGCGPPVVATGKTCGFQPWVSSVYDCTITSSTQCQATRPTDPYPTQEACKVDCQSGLSNCWWPDPTMTAACKACVAGCQQGAWRACTAQNRAAEQPDGCVFGNVKLACDFK